MQNNKITLFREVSAKTGNQVTDAFKSLGEILLSKNKNRGSDIGNKTSLNNAKGQLSHPDSPQSG